MKRVSVIWTYTKDIIIVPDEIYINLDECTDNFLEWVSGVSFDNKIQDATCFGIEQYVEYLNDRYLSECDEKVYLECEDYIPTTKQDIQNLKRMEKIYF